MPLNDQQIQSLGRDALQRAAAGDFASAEQMFARIVEARPNMGQALHLLAQGAEAAIVEIQHQAGTLALDA